MNLLKINCHKIISKISFEEGIDENRTVTLEYTGPVSKSIVEAYHD